MCWKSYKTPIRYTANKDIKCYKVFDKADITWDISKQFFKKIREVKSLFQKYLYIPYNINPEINIIRSGYTYDWTLKYAYYIMEGYHSYATLNVAKLYSNQFFHIIECIIPKGTKYFINENKEIISSNIIITDEVIK